MLAISLFAAAFADGCSFRRRHRFLLPFAICRHHSIADYKYADISPLNIIIDDY
jgi:hypothetical protein